MVIFAASQRHLPVRSGETKGIEGGGKEGWEEERERERKEGGVGGGEGEREEGRERRGKGERREREGGKARERRKVKQRCDKIQMFHKPPTLMSGRRILSMNVSQSNCTLCAFTAPTTQLTASMHASCT